MLCQFSFKNFMSYKDETVFDMQAENIDEFADSTISFKNASSLLPVSVIYGPNGGGKSNLLKALSCLFSLVVKPIYNLKKTKTEFIIQRDTPCYTFALDNCTKDAPTEFNIYFRTDNNEFRYYIAVQNNNIISETLHRRTLGGKKTAVIFEREKNEITLGSGIKSSKLSTDVNPQIPYLSFLAITYDIPIIVEVQKWFESCIVRDYAIPMVEHHLILSSQDSFKETFVNALNCMGIDISDYRYDESQKNFYLQRNLETGNYEMPLGLESEGTKKIFSALPVILLALSEGSLVVIDELDAKLHPKLLRYVISLFTDYEVNKKGAQLLFTSHDMSTMKNDVFRRDEIWFASLNKEHSSEIYSLYEIRNEDGRRITPGASFDKQYMEGRYGADPYLRRMLKWEKNK